MRTLLVCVLAVALVGFVFAGPKFEKRLFESNPLQPAWDKVKEIGGNIRDAYNKHVKKHVNTAGKILWRVFQAKVAADIIHSAIKHTRNKGK